MKSMGLELPGMGGGDGGGPGGEGGVGGGGRKREGLMREARYGVGSKLVDEGAEPTMVFVIVEGECRIVKSGKTRLQSQSQTQPCGERQSGRKHIAVKGKTGSRPLVEERSHSTVLDLVGSWKSVWGMLLFDAMFVRRLPMITLVLENQHI